MKNNSTQIFNCRRAGFMNDKYLDRICGVCGKKFGWHQHTTDRCPVNDKQDGLYAETTFINEKHIMKQLHRMKGEELTQEEINALASVGKVGQNWYAVMHDTNSMPFAIFQNKEYAEAYTNQFCRTAIVEPWPMIIKDYSRGGGN